MIFTTFCLGNKFSHIFVPSIQCINPPNSFTIHEQLFNQVERYGQQLHSRIKPNQLFDDRGLFEFSNMAAHADEAMLLHRSPNLNDFFISPQFNAILGYEEGEGPAMHPQLLSNRRSCAFPLIKMFPFFPLL